MANLPLLTLFSSDANYWGRLQAATGGPSALDFLAEHFTVLGIDFQWWMPIVGGALALYVLWLRWTGQR
jgi:hypothetical protein